MTAPLSRILYVEDDPDIQEVGQMVLSSVGGFKVTSCNGGADALKALEKGDFQLVLLDVMMPGMDGPSTLRAMRATPKGRDISVIFVTAKVQKTEIDSYMAMGAIGVICKPFDAMTLSDTIQKLWAQHQPT